MGNTSPATGERWCRRENGGPHTRLAYCIENRRRLVLAVPAPRRAAWDRRTTTVAYPKGTVPFSSNENWDSPPLIPSQSGVGPLAPLQTAYPSTAIFRQTCPVIPADPLLRIARGFTGSWGGGPMTAGRGRRGLIVVCLGCLAFGGCGGSADTRPPRQTATKTEQQRTSRPPQPPAPPAPPIPSERIAAPLIAAKPDRTTRLAQTPSVVPPKPAAAKIDRSMSAPAPPQTAVAPPMPARPRRRDLGLSCRRRVRKWRRWPPGGRRSRPR